MFLLKIIGLTLLSLLGLAVLGLCLLLFVPVRYRARAEAHGLTVEADIRASWLLKLVRLQYIRAAGAEELRLYALFFRIRLEDSDEAPPAQDETGADIRANEGRSASPAATIQTPTEASKPKDDAAPRATSDGAHKRSSRQRGRTNGFASKIKGIEDGIRGILSKISDYKNYPNRNRIISETWALGKRLCKAVLPKQLRLSGEIGLSRPHETAYLFAAFSVLHMPVSEVRPNFEKPAFSLALSAQGGLNLWSILWPLFRYAIKRPIWPLTKKILFKKGDHDE